MSRLYSSSRTESVYKLCHSRTGPEHWAAASVCSRTRASVMSRLYSSSSRTESVYKVCHSRTGPEHWTTTSVCSRTRASVMSRLYSSSRTESVYKNYHSRTGPLQHQHTVSLPRALLTLQQNRTRAVDRCIAAAELRVCTRTTTAEQDQSTGPLQHHHYSECVQELLHCPCHTLGP
ncbi:hypothetical protein WMY93_024704 [Mugilogobius chulae]|uniref:Uncharacterized protein n=1 Tax=Mugilogobius chulae TaxID=88201 RepID=A0AAW0N5X3_9GOBI